MAERRLALCHRRGFTQVMPAFAVKPADAGSEFVLDDLFQLRVAFEKVFPPAHEHVLVVRLDIECLDHCTAENSQAERRALAVRGTPPSAHRERRRSCPCHIPSPDVESCPRTAPDARTVSARGRRTSMSCCRLARNSVHLAVHVGSRHGLHFEIIACAKPVVAEDDDGITTVHPRDGRARFHPCSWARSWSGVILLRNRKLATE